MLDLLWLFHNMCKYWIMYTWNKHVNYTSILKKVVGKFKVKHLYTSLIVLGPERNPVEPYRKIIILVYCCVTSHPQILWFKQRPFYLLIILWVRNSGRAQWGWLYSAPCCLDWGASTGPRAGSLSLCLILCLLVKASQRASKHGWIQETEKEIQLLMGEWYRHIAKGMWLRWVKEACRKRVHYIWSSLYEIL